MKSSKDKIFTFNSKEIKAYSSGSGTEIHVTAGIPEAKDIASFLLQLSAGEDEPDPLTHLRLQKLMYYVQAWSLALRNKPAFTGRIEAWAHGPVVKDLYALLANFGNQPLPPDAVKNASQLSKEDAEFVVSVWDAYKQFSATALRQMTHSEFPWIQARGTCGPADRCDTEIAHTDMRAHFRKQAQ
jgi:uncharacterized phage-associated protein